MILRPVFRPIGSGGGSGASAIPGVDADAVSWAERVIAAGGTYKSATLAAVSNFCVSAKASGYWGKLNRINLFCGDGLTAALVPLKVGGGNATETNVNFVSGDYSESTGLTGDGTSKYLRSGLDPSVTLSANDTHLAVYNRAGSATGGIHIGVRSGTDFFELLAPDSAGTGQVYSRQYDNTPTQGRLGIVQANPYGLMIGSRTASNAHALYRNGVSLATATTSGGTLPAFEMYVFSSNSGGAPFGNYVGHAVGAYSIGSGLTQADATDYATHMETFQDALGRGVM